MNVRQGEIYYVDLPTKGEELPEEWGSGPSGPHPVVVVQHDSRILDTLNTVVVCVITGNTDLADTGGNVTLYPGKTGLSKTSVVNVSQVLTLDKGFLGRPLGETDVVEQNAVLRGVRGVLEGFKVPY